MKNEKKSKHFLIFFSVLIVIIIALTYYRIFVTRNYPVISPDQELSDLPAWVVDIY